MCGILGLVTDHARLSPNSLDAARHQLQHRGPDFAASAAFCDGQQVRGNGKLANVVFAHVRLAVIDLNERSNQPMSFAGLHITFNGEIYNYRELREILLGLGHRFITDGDTEVILHAYRQWGEDCLTHFNGMWAFAIYDVAQRRVFFSRDRLGVKPFYYHFSDGTFAFSSEIRPLHTAIGKRPEINRDSLSVFLTSSETDYGSRTLYCEAHELRGGEFGTLDLDSFKMRVSRYWDLVPQETPSTLDGAIDRFAELFEDSCRLRLRADIPLSLTLSGGVDSSCIAAALATTGHSGEVTAYTSKFPGAGAIDESAYAARVSKACGLRQEFVTPQLCGDAGPVEELIAHQELPIGSLSLLVHKAILRQIREDGIRVVLAGQGGDELFLGYERYFVTYLRQKLPSLRVIPDACDAARNSRLTARDLAMFSIYFGSHSVRMHLLQRAANKYYRIAPAEMNGVGVKSFSSIRALQRHEIQNGQLSHLLRYDDRNSSSLGMETRLPFLDYRLVEFAYNLRTEFKIHEGWTKYVLRCYLERAGLEDIAWRRHKLGFDAPHRSWFESLVRDGSAWSKRPDLLHSVLRPGVTPAQLPEKHRWHIYNLSILAERMEWTFADAA